MKTFKYYLLPWVLLRLSILAVASEATAEGVKTDAYNWNHVEILAGGFIPGIVFSEKKPGLAYCRTDIGGAYRWDVVMKEWMPLMDWAGPGDYNLMGIESIAIDPVDTRRVYFAAGMYPGGKAAILRSSDQGRTFDIINVPFAMGGNENGRGMGERLAIDPNQTKTLYFGSRYDGLWVSKDSADTWTKVQSFPFPGIPRSMGSGGAGISFVIFNPVTRVSGSGSRTIFAGIADRADANLYRSDDAGASWSKVPGQPGGGLMPRHGVLDAASQVLYLAYGNGVGPNGITDGALWKLDLKSNAWSNVSPLLPGAPGAGAFGYGGLSLDKQHPGTLMVATLDRWGRDDVFRTTDGGKTWRGIRNHSQREPGVSPYIAWGHKDGPDLGWWIDAVAIDPFDSKHVLYGTGATIWGTHDMTELDAGHATHWKPEVAGIEETAVTDLISPGTGAHLISGLGDIGGFVHEDITVSPAAGMVSNPNLSTTTGLDFAESNPSIIARVGRGPKGEIGGYSKDGGMHWSPLMGNKSGGVAGKIAVAADGSTLVWTPENQGALISKDEGKTWVACKGLPSGVHPIADRLNAAKFYALDLSDGTLYRSTDGGATFVGSKVEGFETGRRGDGNLRTASGHEGDLWLCSRGKLYEMEAAGNKFVAIDGAGRVNAFGFGKAAPWGHYPALYMAGTIGKVEGIFRSDDEGKSWVRINDGQTQYGYQSPVIGDSRIYGRVYFGTNGRGIVYGDIKDK